MKLLALFFVFAPGAFAAPAGPLAGVWNRDGVPYAELRADGKGTVDQEAVRWTADARALTLRYESGKVQTMAYALRGKTLTVVLDGQSYVYTRGAKASAAKSDKGELTRLLLSSAWCSFRYNKISGSSHQERVVFRADGTWDSGARGETWSSGAAGTVSGQTDSSSGGRWRVKGAALLMSRGPEPLGDVGLSVSRNSNGYPILNTGGKEYSSCH